MHWDLDGRNLLYKERFLEAELRVAGGKGLFKRCEEPNHVRALNKDEFSLVAGQFWQLRLVGLVLLGEKFCGRDRSRSHRRSSRARRASRRNATSHPASNHIRTHLP